jgi:hypothetical protein
LAVCVGSTHEPEQLSGVPLSTSQVTTHTPLLHVPIPAPASGSLHTWPHAPQLRGSCCTFVHAAPHWSGVLPLHEGPPSPASASALAPASASASALVSAPDVSFGGASIALSLDTSITLPSTEPSAGPQALLSHNAGASDPHATSQALRTASNGHVFMG